MKHCNCVKEKCVWEREWERKGFHVFILFFVCLFFCHMYCFECFCFCHCLLFCSVCNAHILLCRSDEFVLSLFIKQTWATVVAMRAAKLPNFCSHLNVHCVLFFLPCFICLYLSFDLFFYFTNFVLVFFMHGCNRTFWFKPRFFSIKCKITQGFNLSLTSKVWPVLPGFRFSRSRLISVQSSLEDIVVRFSPPLNEGQFLWNNPRHYSFMWNNPKHYWFMWNNPTHYWFMWNNPKNYWFLCVYDSTAASNIDLL